MTKLQRSAVAALATLILAPAASAFTIELTNADFGVTPTFSDTRQFRFTLEVDAPLAPGVYVDPVLQGIDYRISGSLEAGTPSGFPGFNLVRSISGTDFYAQGSSLRFEISALADLSDGLQANELVGSDAIFVLDAREVDTGRYHPPLFQLNADGTGSIRNSNNQGGINPATQELVDVDFGEEYVTELTFTPSALLLSVPEPGTGLLLAAGLLGIASSRRATSLV